MCYTGFMTVQKNQIGRPLKFESEEQIQILSDLQMQREGLKLVQDKGGEREEKFSFRYFDLIAGVRCDSQGLGDFPSDFLRDHSGLSMDNDSQVMTSPQSKNEMYTLFDASLFREPGDPLRFSYFAADPLAGEFEVQMTSLVKACKGDRELLSPYAPKEPGAHDDACSMAALGCLVAVDGVVGDILVL